MKVVELLAILSRCDLNAEVCLDVSNNYDENIVSIEYIDPQLREPNICNFKGIVWISNYKTPIDDNVFKIT